MIKTGGSDSRPGTLHSDTGGTIREFSVDEEGERDGWRHRRRPGPESLVDVGESVPSGRSPHLPVLPPSARTTGPLPDARGWGVDGWSSLSVFPLAREGTIRYGRPRSTTSSRCKTRVCVEWTLESQELWGEVCPVRRTVRRGYEVLGVTSTGRQSDVPTSRVASDGSWGLGGGSGLRHRHDLGRGVVVDSTERSGSEGI